MPGCEKFFRPGYVANLTSAWIPALNGVQEKLEAGARVADIGCGKGASMLLLANAFPKSRFFGFDYHDKSIEAARESASAKTLPTASASTLPRPRNSRAKTTTSSPCSIACTIWATPSERLPMSGSRWQRMALG